MVGTAAPDRFDAVFAALADPTRRAIVRRLADGEATVLELAEPFPISLPAVSRHLKVLERAGLISRGRDGQRRPCRLRPEPLGEIAVWAEHTRAAWEQRLDRLDAHLRRTADRADFERADFDRADFDRADFGRAAADPSSPVPAEETP